VGATAGTADAGAAEMDGTTVRATRPVTTAVAAAFLVVGAIAKGEGGGVKTNGSGSEPMEWRLVVDEQETGRLTGMHVARWEQAVGATGAAV